MYLYQMFSFQFIIVIPKFTLFDKRNISQPSIYLENKKAINR